MNKFIPNGNKVARDRKYKVFWGAFIVTAILLFFDKITGDQWVTMSSVEFMTYMAGNVSGKFSNKEKDNVGNR